MSYEQCERCWGIFGLCCAEADRVPRVQEEHAAIGRELLKAQGEADRLRAENAALRSQLPTDAERAVLAAAKAQETAREELAQLPRCHHSIVTWCPNCDVLRSARRTYDDAAKLLMRSPRAAYGKERG